MKKENILQTLSFLALKMENSGTTVLEAIAPDSIAHLDCTFTRQNESTTFKEFGKAETGEIVEKLDYVAEFLKITNIVKFQVLALDTLMIIFGWKIVIPKSIQKKYRI